MPNVTLELETSRALAIALAFFLSGIALRSALTLVTDALAAAARRAGGG